MTGFFFGGFLSKDAGFDRSGGLEWLVCVDAYIAVGSNLGDRHGTILSAIQAIGFLDSTTLCSQSTLIETAPVGDIEQDSYINGMIHVQTELGARALLDGLLGIESAYGRDRSIEQRWGPRTLDLDLIVFGNQVIDEPGLVVPHPRLHERAFVLIPLVEITPDVILPVHNQTPRQLLKALGGAG